MSETRSCNARVSAGHFFVSHTSNNQSSFSRTYTHFFEKGYTFKKKCVIYKYVDLFSVLRLARSDEQVHSSPTHGTQKGSRSILRERSRPFRVSLSNPIVSN